MVGIGGGVLYTPIQVFAGIPFNTAASNSLFLIMVSSISAAFVYRKEKIIDPFIVTIFSISTFSGSFIGGFSAGFFNESILLILFTTILIYNGFSLIKKNSKNDKTAIKTRYSITRGFGENEYYINIIIAVSGSFLAGFFGGLLGIGGGIFLIPLMILALKIPSKIAFTNSSIIIGITGLGGLSGRIFHYPPSWESAILFAIAALLGARIGAKFSLKTDSGKLRTYLGLLFLLVGIVTGIKGLR